jgi:hypothetical protein
LVEPGLHLEERVFAPRRERHMRAFTHERAGHRRADAAGRPGHHRDLAPQVPEVYA